MRAHFSVVRCQYTPSETRNLIAVRLIVDHRIRTASIFLHKLQWTTLFPPVFRNEKDDDRVNFETTQQHAKDEDPFSQKRYV
jgi:hypothetical protein